MSNAALLEIYEGESSQADDDQTPDWRWRALAGNGEVVSQGEGHTSARDALRAAKGVLPGIPVFKVVDGERVPIGVHATDRYSEIKSMLGIPDSEPIFILRAQDIVSVDVLNEYAWAVYDHRVDAKDEIVDRKTDTFLAEIDAERERFKQWQDENPDRVKIPD